MVAEDVLVSAIRHCPPGETGTLLAEYYELVDGPLGGTSALVFACYIGRHDVAEAIARRRGMLRPFEAAAIGDTKTLALLIAQDRAALDDTSPDGFQPLGLACFFKHEEAARLLVEAGAAIDAPSKNSSRVAPLHSAVAVGKIGIVGLLLDHGAPVDAPQQNGYTPLMAAAHLGDAEIVDLLLARGADKTLKDNDGKRAADHALASNHTALADLLKVEEPAGGGDHEALAG